MMYKCIYAIIWTCTDMCLFLDKNWQTAYSCSVDKDLLVNLVCTVQMQHLFSPALVFTLRSENGYPTFSIYIYFRSIGFLPFYLYFQLLDIYNPFLKIDFWALLE